MSPLHKESHGLGRGGQKSREVDQPLARGHDLFPIATTTMSSTASEVSRIIGEYMLKGWVRCFCVVIAFITFNLESRS